MNVCMCFRFHMCCIINTSHPLITGIIPGDEKKNIWSSCLCKFLHPLKTSSALPHYNPRLLQIFSRFTVRMYGAGVCATARLWATNRRSLCSSDWRPHDYRFPSDYQIINRVLLHRLQSPVWNREYEIIWTAVLWRSFTWTAWDAEFFAKLTK